MYHPLLLPKGTYLQGHGAPGPSFSVKWQFLVTCHSASRQPRQERRGEAEQHGELCPGTLGEPLSVHRPPLAGSVLSLWLLSAGGGNSTCSVLPATRLLPSAYLTPGAISCDCPPPPPAGKANDTASCPEKGPGLLHCRPPAVDLCCNTASPLAAFPLGGRCTMEQCVGPGASGFLTGSPEQAAPSWKWEGGTAWLLPYPVREASPQNLVFYH